MRLLAILFLALWGSFMVPFRGGDYNNGSGVSAGPVPVPGEVVSLGIHNEHVSPNSSGRPVGRYLLGFLHSPLQSSRKHPPRIRKRSAAAVAGGRLQKRTARDDEAEIPFQRRWEDEDRCQKRADATLTILSHRRGQVFVSWTEICVKNIPIINVERFHVKRSNPEKETQSQPGCNYTNPAFGFGPDEMTVALPTMLNRMVDQVLTHFVLGCIAVFYRYAEINWPNPPQLNSTITEMWPAVQLV